MAHCKQNITVEEFFKRIDVATKEVSFYRTYNERCCPNHYPTSYETYIVDFGFDKECNMDPNPNPNPRGVLVDDVTKQKLVEISGYLVYSASTHEPTYFVERYDSLEAVTAFLLSGAGLCNLFTSNIFVFYNGELLNYHVNGTDGRRMTYENLKYSESVLDSSGSCNCIWCRECHQSGMQNDH